MSTTKDNVINVSFSLNCCATTVTPRYQWDKGVVLCIKNIQPKESVFLHCSFEGQRTPAYVMTMELKDRNLYGVIPDEMFQQAKQIRCYLYMDNSENGTTIFEVAIPVIPRAKPSDYIYDPMEVIPDVGELLSAWNTVRDVSEKASQVANMTVEAGTLPAGSAATASYQDGKLTLGIPRGLDSETALPTGYKPFDMLVVGPDGKPRWEERTHYDYTGGGTILPLTDLQLVGGYCTFKDPFDNIPVVGFPYHVTYYGYDYDLIAKEWMEDGVRCVTLGNQRDLGGTDWTQEPFIIVFYPEKSIFGTYGYFSCSATSKDTIAVSIESVGELKKIDPKFLPEGSGGGLPTGGEPYKQLVTDDEGNAVWEDRLAYETTGTVEILPEQTYDTTQGTSFEISTPLKMPIEAGKTYTCYFNEEVFQYVAQSYNGLVIVGNLARVDGSGDTGEPFAFIYIPDALAAIAPVQSNLVLFDVSGEIKFSLCGDGSQLKTIHPKYLPEGIGYETEGDGVILPETACSFQEMACNIFEPLQGGIIPGEEYTVVFDGNIYKTTAKEFSDEGMTATVLGNLVVAGGEDTGEPFLAIVTPPELSELAGGATLMINSLDENFSPETLAILGISKVVHTIPMKYLPDNLYGDFEHEQKTILEETEVDFTNSEYGYLMTPLKEVLQIGREYLVKFGGVEYSVVCSDERNEHGELECEHFLIVPFPVPLAEEGLGVINGYVNLYDESLQGSIVTLSIKMAAYTEVRKVPDKYIRETAPVIVRIKGNTNSVSSVSHTYEELRKEYEAGRTIVCIWERDSSDHRVGQFASYNSTGATFQFHYKDSGLGDEYVIQIGKYKNLIEKMAPLNSALYLMSTGSSYKMEITIDDNGTISAKRVG